MFERFTDDARAAIVRAQEEARALGHNYIGTEHLLLGVLSGAGAGVQELASRQVTLDVVRDAIVRAVGQGSAPPGAHVPFTPRAKKVLELSLREALSLGHNYIGTEHLLLGILRDGDGIAVQVLTSTGVSVNELRSALVEGAGAEPAMSGSGGGGAERSGRGNGSLEKFGRNLTAAAKAGELDPVVGRDREVRRLMQVLVRRTKNNPVLIGEPGVGKTAVVEGLAQLIAEGDVPPKLSGLEVVSLDMGGVVAGSRYRGDFEERVKNILADVKARGNIVLFIDEIHTLVGAGGSEGAVDAANMLKPMLARGELRLIGATTLDEFRKYFEKDAALERRFQSIMVEEPSVSETLEIMRGLRKRYEEHHEVQITDEALASAVRLSQRYITSRKLPDKAVDLIDEAAARLRIEMHAPEREVLLTQRETLSGEHTEALAAGDMALARELSDRLRALEQAIEAAPTEDESVPLVTSDQVGLVVSDITGIPVAQMSSAETDRLVRLEAELERRVVGQNRAVGVLAKAVRRARSGLKDPNRPSGSFLFAGPSGVGKTELAKALAEQLFGDEKALISIDMSEFMESHTVARLFGAPPGYVGYDEGGQLTERIRRRPYSVLLLDEVEKAHPDVFNALLQVLEEGRLTDGQGREVDFKNTVVIMTSNLGSQDVVKGASLGFVGEGDGSEEARIEARVRDALKKHFRPEFLNRIDETVVFGPLSREHMGTIVDLFIARVGDRLADLGMEIELTEDARELLADRGFDPHLGARPLRRVIQREVEDRVSEAVLLGQVTAGDLVLVSVVDDDFALSSIPRSSAQPLPAESEAGPVA